jgi:hypothetical protein
VYRVGSSWDNRQERQAAGRKDGVMVMGEVDIQRISLDTENGAGRLSHTIQSILICFLINFLFFMLYILGLDFTHKRKHGIYLSDLGLSHSA